MIMSGGLYFWLVAFTCAAIWVATRVTTAAAKRIDYLQVQAAAPPPPVWAPGPEGPMLVQPPAVQPEVAREVPAMRFATVWAVTFGVVWAILMFVIFFMSQVTTY